MNMLTSVLIKLGLAVFSALPVERVVAMLLNKWLDKIDSANMDKAGAESAYVEPLLAGIGKEVSHG